jgi:hypothetical protein
MTDFDLSDIASPFTTSGIKAWPVHSRPGFSWFIAHEGKPHYFVSKAEALQFIAMATGSEA